MIISSIMQHVLGTFPNRKEGTVFKNSLFKGEQSKLEGQQHGKRVAMIVDRIRKVFPIHLKSVSFSQQFPHGYYSSVWEGFKSGDSDDLAGEIRKRSPCIEMHVDTCVKQ